MSVDIEEIKRNLLWLTGNIGMSVENRARIETAYILIEQQQVEIEKLKTNFANADNSAKYHEDLIGARDSQIQHLENKLKNQWISVDDRLPKKHDYYLVCHKHDNDSKTNIDKLIYSYSHGGWISTYGAKYSGIVTHWMPLPEPPEVK